MEDQAEQLRRRMNDIVAAPPPPRKRYVTSERGRFIEIADLSTGRATELPASAYRDERRALRVFFARERSTRPACATVNS